MCARRREIAFFIWPMSLDTEGRSRKKIAFGNPKPNRRSPEAKTTARARELTSCKIGSSDVPASFGGMRPGALGNWKKCQEELRVGEEWVSTSRSRWTV